MNEQLADNLQEIVSLFQLTKPLAIPQNDGGWIVVEAFDLSEVAPLTLALGFFLRRAGNRAERLQQSKIDLLSIKH